MIVIAITLAVIRGRNQEPADERDRSILLRGYRSAYFTLTAALSTITVGLLIWGEASDSGAPLPRIGHGAWANAVLLSFFTAELAKSLTQVVLYRRGA
jgi:hypothetical protein